MRFAALSMLLSACAMPVVETGGTSAPVDGEEAPEAPSSSASGWALELERLDADLAFHTARFDETGSWLEGERAAALAINADYAPISAPKDAYVPVTESRPTFPDIGYIALGRCGEIAAFFGKFKKKKRFIL